LRGEDIKLVPPHKRSLVLDAMAAMVGSPSIIKVYLGVTGKGASLVKILTANAANF
jgi:formate-dependent phosphoribosylglycinamide formyltransferase (GAR transformylase)